MNKPWCDLQEITDSHDISSFRCGLDQVDDWFHNQAHRENLAGRVRTHVCLDQHGSVTAFFALKHIVVNLQSASKTMLKNADANGMATGLLLAQMGVDQAHQGNGAGGALLKEVFHMASALHQKASFNYLVTDAATEELVVYYTRRGFTPIGNDRRLIMKASTFNGIADRG